MTRPRYQHWHLAGGLALLFLLLDCPPAMAQTASSPWHLSPSPFCVERCARFLPRDGSTPLEQRWFQSIPLSAAGALELPAGTFKLWQSARDHERTIELLGPAVLEVTGEQLRLLSPTRGLYKGRGGSDASSAPPLSLPPLVAGVHGTQFEFMVTLQGTVFLAVTEGGVELAWEETTLGKSMLVNADQAAVANRADFQAGTLHSIPGEDISQTRGMLLAADEAVRSRGSATAEGAFALFSSRLALESPEANAQRARELATAWPKEPVAPHALYLAWNRADALGLTAVAEPLAALLLARFPESTWCPLLSARQGQKPRQKTPDLEGVGTSRDNE